MKDTVRLVGVKAHSHRRATRGGFIHSCGCIHNPYLITRIIWSTRRWPNPNRGFSLVDTAWNMPWQQAFLRGNARRYGTRTTNERNQVSERAYRLVSIIWFPPWSFISPMRCHGPEKNWKKCTCPPGIFLARKRPHKELHIQKTLSSLPDLWLTTTVQYHHKNNPQKIDTKHMLPKGLTHSKEQSTSPSLLPAPILQKPKPNSGIWFRFWIALYCIALRTTFLSTIQNPQE